jgi:hypothetical protein
MVYLWKLGIVGNLPWPVSRFCTRQCSCRLVHHVIVMGWCSVPLENIDYCNRLTVGDCLLYQKISSILGYVRIKFYVHQVATSYVTSRKNQANLGSTDTYKFCWWRAPDSSLTLSGQPKQDSVSDEIFRSLYFSLLVLFFEIPCILSFYMHDFYVHHV